MTTSRDEPEDSKPEASQSQEAAPAEKEEVEEPEEPKEKEPEKGPEKVEETPQPPAKEESSAEQPPTPQSEAKSEGTFQQAAPTREEIFPKDADAATSEKPAEATEQGEPDKPNAFSAMMEGKSPEDPQQLQKAASSDQPPEARNDETQKAEDSTPSAPPNKQAGTEQQEAEKPSESTKQGEALPADEERKSSVQETTSSTDEKKDSAPTTNGDAVEPKAREDDVPSSILEKGIVYFFFRARVNVSDPQSTSDIARSYLVLRPLPHGAALSDGTIPEGNNSRLIALPKKILPVSGKDRFLVFVEKAQASFSELKNDFMSASDYATKTQGTSHIPAVTPVAEGVYAITTTGRESHLAYMTTIPSTLGEVQKDIGLRDSGSFVVSAKNPKFPSPANAGIGGDPGYSEEIMQEFRDLRWMPLQPKLLDYVNTQFLLIGESRGVDGAMGEGKQGGEEGMKEEMERLEGEDEVRVQGLSGKCSLLEVRAGNEGVKANESVTGNDAVFADLGLSKREYPQVPSTW